jgi:hypothetical protein
MFEMRKATFIFFKTLLRSEPENFFIHYKNMGKSAKSPEFNPFTFLLMIEETMRPSQFTVPVRSLAAYISLCVTRGNS